MTPATPLHVIRNAALAIGVVAVSALAAITTVKSSINTGDIVDEAVHETADAAPGPQNPPARSPEQSARDNANAGPAERLGDLHDLEAQLPPENFIFAPGSGDAARPMGGPRQQVVSVSRGDTLMDLLTSAGLARGEAYYAIEALKDVFSPRRLRPGQEIELTTAPAIDGGERLLWLSLAPDVERDVVVLPAAGEERYAAQSIERPLAAELVGAEAKIHTSLFEAAADAGVPPPVLVEMIRTFSFDVDFQRDVQPGDTFQLVYKRFLDENGDIAKTGEVLYAQLSLSGRDYGLYRFVDKDGFEDYYAAEGKSVRKALMRTPIDGARLSSGFGKRRHPILGYTKMHKGTDFAAPTGTPIYAAGNGTVARASRYGGYGNYVRIRHNSTYQTAYAHMHGYAKGIRAGARVKQGQVIGYVGSTGRSTGPHLHYEVLVNGKQVNPRSIKLPSGKTLAGEELFRFSHERARIDALRERLLGTPTRVACAEEAC